MASEHRKNLMEMTGLFDAKDHAQLKENESQLSRLKNELKSMAYERVVMGVLTKQTLRNAKRGGPQLSSAPPTHVLSTSRRANTAVESNKSKSALTTNRQKPIEQQESRCVGINVVPTDPDEPIVIPRFRGTKEESKYIIENRTAAIASKAKTTKFEIVAAQDTAGSTVIPSMRSGTLPAELRAIKTEPANKGASATAVTPKKGLKRTPKRHRSRSRSPVGISDRKTPKKEPNAAFNSAIDGMKEHIERSHDQMVEMKKKLEETEAK